VKDNNEEYVLPLLNKTSDQLFFIGYAQVSNLFLALYRHHTIIKDHPGIQVASK